MKHFLDIQNIREETIFVGDMERPANVGAFEPGNIISITEKIDGANASAYWDTETNTMHACSRKNDLNYNLTLNGFWNYVQEMPEPWVMEFKKHSSWIVFGEWMGARNKIVYRPDVRKKWLVYDIFNTETGQYEDQKQVKIFCQKTGLEYIKEYYFGPFISWEHCRSFCHMNYYGDTQEGVIVKNMTKLADAESRQPAYIKIVNIEFKESMLKSSKVIDPEKEVAKETAQVIIDAIVTPNRVEKMLNKLHFEGILPDVITPQDMRTVAQNLPLRVYEDCMKEEFEAVKAAGECAGKMINSRTMFIAKQIILGN